MKRNMEEVNQQETPTCPQCGEVLPQDVRNCPGCGVDFLLLALLTERSYLEGMPEAAPSTPETELLVPRIGDYLLDQGLITEEQLIAALDRQKSLAAQGEHKLLGQILIELGSTDNESLDRAINLQILQLHTALKEANETLEERVEERTAELKMALERLTEINQIKANLISNVSHELRTPLAHIKGYLELVMDEELGDLTEAQKNAITVMQRSTSRLERLIEDLIEFSTASREGIHLRLQPCSVKDLSADVIQASQVKAESAGITLDNLINEQIPAVRADPERLEWVLLQLIDNAIKFSPNGGHVTVDVKYDQNFVTIYIQDTGVGIPPDRIDEIFIPFHQLDGSPTRQYGGTGLGLSLVKLVLDAHGSELQVESVPNEGSTFSFPIPVATDIE